MEFLIQLMAGLCMDKISLQPFSLLILGTMSMFQTIEVQNILEIIEQFIQMIKHFGSIHLLILQRMAKQILNSLELILDIRKLLMLDIHKEHLKCLQEFLLNLNGLQKESQSSLLLDPLRDLIIANQTF